MRGVSNQGLCIDLRYLLDMATVTRHRAGAQHLQEVQDGEINVGNIQLPMPFRAWAGCSHQRSVASERRRLSQALQSSAVSQVLLGHSAHLDSSAQRENPREERAQLSPATVTSVLRGQLPSTSQTQYLRCYKSLYSRAPPRTGIDGTPSIPPPPAFAPGNRGLGNTPHLPCFCFISINIPQPPQESGAGEFLFSAFTPNPSTAQLLCFHLEFPSSSLVLEVR